MTTTRRLAAILAADVAGYSAAMERDEEGTAEAVRALRREVIEPKLAEHHGRLIKTTGDGFLAEFASPIAALRCALAIQQRPDESGGLRLRIGLNLGDVIIEEGGDLLGEGVNIAARLESLAEPGSILVSDKIVREVEGKVEAAFEDRGEQQVKNISKPVRAYVVRTAVASTGLSISLDSKPLALPDKPSIAVLPFQNMSGDPEQDYFADGIVEDITTTLSRFRDLFVIARNSSFTYKGKTVDIKQVGRELGVRYVLEGSVRKAGTRVRITGQLIEAATNKHLWADRFDGALEDVFELQDQVTTRVVGAVAPTIERAEIGRATEKATADLGAYDYYLRGRAVHMGRSRESNLTALALYRRATELDPEFARAYAWTTYCRQVAWLSDWVSDRPQTVAEGTASAEMAVSFGQRDAEALSLAAFFYALVRHDLDVADRIIDQAVQLNPNLVIVRAVRGWISVWLGHHDEAIHQLEALIRLNPSDIADPTNAYAALAAAYNHTGHSDVAIVWAEKCLVRSPRHLPALTNAMVASALLGDHDAAHRYGQRLLVISPRMSISRAREFWAFRRSEDLQRTVSAYRVAGVPE